MKRWFLKSHISSINLIEQKDRPDSDWRGDFFDTWEEAHQQLLGRTELSVIRAKKALSSAINSFDRAKKMKKPESND